MWQGTVGGSQFSINFGTRTGPTSSANSNTASLIVNNDQQNGLGADHPTITLSSNEKTGAFDATRRAKLSGDVQGYPWVLVAPAWEPDGRGLVFSARSGDTANLWRLGISSKTWKVTGAPELFCFALVIMMRLGRY